MSEVASPATARVAIVTLGCGRNEVDSEQLAGLLAGGGHEVVDDPAAAEVVLVNTCTFIGPAKQESIDTILAACDLKGQGAMGVVVVGCMAERYGNELAAELPEADAVVGFDGYPSLPGLVGDVAAGRPHQRVVGRSSQGQASTTERPATTRPSLPLLVMPTAAEEAPPERAPQGRVETHQDELDRIPASGPRFPVRQFSGDRPWAYLKIASGCDRVCTFCAIPSFRGRFRSRPVDELVAEATWLAGRGAKELVLVSENTTSYGKDIGGRELQSDLLRALAAVDGIERLRLAYLQPAELQRPLLETMAELPEVAGYYDLSLQHVSHDVLQRMARSGSPERFAQLIATIRELDPQAVFRSNFILGFPGETDHDVALLEEFLTAQQLDWVGLFTFSREDGTPSADLPDQIPAEVAHERLQRISEIQEHVANRAAARFVGSRLEVIVDDVEPGVWCAGRSHREAPETDGEVRLVTGDGEPMDLPVGRTVTATVDHAEGVDFVAVPEHPDVAV
ncbi:MAG: 30S ribosomal protein S12 methylthiotransferase RimO [Nitriliruptorales bacterium]|nr:30S ribosomal protein S12 methylthiotransferase RimO [Nitriliruptorales bacterium]